MYIYLVSKLLARQCILGYSIADLHVPIFAPSQNEDVYMDIKNFLSIDIQAICDSIWKSLTLWLSELVALTMLSYGGNLKSPERLKLEKCNS